MKTFFFAATFTVGLAMLTMTAACRATDDETFQQRMDVAAVDLAMLNLGGRMLVDRVEACRVERPDWGEVELDAYKARVSADLHAGMVRFLEKRLQDKDADVADIRALQRVHREQLERNIPHEALASAVHLGVLVVNDVDWTCQDR